MTIYSGIFNSVRDGNGNGDRKYNAWWFAKYFATFIGNGVFPNPSTNLQVIENTNMTVKVKPGSGWIDGYFIYSDSDHVLQLDIADGVLKRIDRIVMRLNHLTRQIEIAVKKGTFASNPVAPVLQRDTDAWELALADIRVNNGATQITQANITDTRLNKTSCGIVHGTVNQVDTTTLFNQYQAWIAEQKAFYEAEITQWTATQQAEFEQFQLDMEAIFNNAMQQNQQEHNQMMLNNQNEHDQMITDNQVEFDNWLATIQAILDGDVAGNLLNLINGVRADLTTLEQRLTAHLDETASLTKEGHVQLTSAVNNSSETLAATAKAVKIAYDKAEQAFTQVSNGKQLIGTAITDVDPTATVPDNPTFANLADAIKSIKTGIEINGTSVSRFEILEPLNKGELATYISNGELNILSQVATPPSSASEAVAFSPNGKFLAVGCNKTPFLLIYSITGTTFTKLANPTVLPTSKVVSIAFNPDSDMMCVMSNTASSLITYSINGNTFTKINSPSSLSGSYAYDATFSPKGNFFAIATESSPFILLYQVNGTTFTKLANPAVLPSEYAYTVSFNKAETMLLVGHYGTPCFSVYTIEGTTFTKIANPSNSSDLTGFGRAWFSNDGKIVAVGTSASPFMGIFAVSGTTLTRSSIASLPTSRIYNISFNLSDTMAFVGTQSTPYAHFYAINGTNFELLQNPSTMPTSMTNDVSFDPISGMLAVVTANSPYLLRYVTKIGIGKFDGTVKKTLLVMNEQGNVGQTAEGTIIWEV